MFLVQMEMSDLTYVVGLKTEMEVVDITNEMDFNGVESIKVWNVSEFGKAKELHWLGYEPMCLVRYADEDGNIVISGYGKDH